ncbi:cytochrome P450 [Candidatus Uabimicrobium sp. HlEnr_7]|uniref:cytochrome P450 n=1 Tax=Candidatus Uabimicrobium helgolandensis TaxID=3095367 RepID=UPI00355797DB
MIEETFPGPTRPWWWQVYTLIRNPSYISKCLQKYGDPFYLMLEPKTPFLIFTDPTAAREIFTAHYNDVFAGPVSESLRPILGRESLLLIDGDKHLNMRRFMTPAFTGNAMRVYGSVIRDTTRKNTELWAKDSHVFIQGVMQNISLEVILQAVFGLKEGDRFQKYKQVLVDYISVFNGKNAIFLYSSAFQKDLGIFTPWGKYLKMVKVVDGLIYEEIKLRKKKPNQQDIFSRLLAIRDENGNGLSEKVLRDQLLTLLLAGHETTASALAWAFYWIHRDPQILDTLSCELQPFCNNFDIESITKLPYLDAVCRETLRLYPVIPAVGRLLQRPMSIMGHTLPAKTNVVLSIYLMHHRPDLYPESHLFRPKRFIEREYNSYEYIPFGGGARRCLGIHFAFYEMKIVLAYILLHFQLKLRSNKPISAVRRGVTFLPGGGVPMVIEKKIHQ